MQIAIPEARALVEAAMRKVGHDAREAAIIADHLIDSELRGLAYGGLARALSIIERIRATPTPRGAITLTRETPASAHFDGGDNVGYLVGLRATEAAISKAGAGGVAVVGACRTWYTGMYSYYLERITAAGLAGIVIGSGTQQVAPHGGTEGRLGTNPIAFGFPTTAEPVIWDIGTAGLMIGEVHLKRRLGEKLAPGQAFDAQGLPTVDPVAALGGAFAVWGGHKGSGLSMMIQLTAMLTGQVVAPGPQRDGGFFVLAMQPGLFGDPDEFRNRAAEYADKVRNTRSLDPQQPVRMPFDRSRAERARHLAAGVFEVPDAVVSALRGVADTIKSDN